jgi:hypothetical protein
MSTKNVGANHKGKAAMAPSIASTFENGFNLNEDFIDLNPYMDLTALQAYPQPEMPRGGSRAKGPAPPTGPKGAGVAKARRPGSADRIRKMEEMIQRLGSQTSHDPAARQLVEALQRLHSENVREMQMPVDSPSSAYVSPQPIGPPYPYSAINGDYFYPTEWITKRNSLNGAFYLPTGAIFSYWRWTDLFNHVSITPQWGSQYDVHLAVIISSKTQVFSSSHPPPSAPGNGPEARWSITPVAYGTRGHHWWMGWNQGS